MFAVTTLEENSPCCNDKHEVLIVDDSQTPVISLPPISPEFFALREVININPVKVIEYTGIQLFSDNFSPPPQGAALQDKLQFRFL